MPPANTKKKPRIGPGRLSAEQTAELPDRLLDAAFVLFTELGFAGASMEHIAKRAGASTKTLYSRFANKSEILEAVVLRNVQRTVADHLRGFALRPEDSDPRDYLIKFTTQIGMANQVADTAGIVRLTFAESHRFPVFADMYREVTGRAINAMTRALQVWRDEGKLDFDANPHELANLAWGMLTHEMRVLAVMGNPMSRAEIQRYVTLGVDVFLKGIQSERPKRVTKRK